MLRMPMGNQDGLNISIPVVMANNHTGQVLRAALGAGVKLIASMHPKVRLACTSLLPWGLVPHSTGRACVPSRRNRAFPLSRCSSGWSWTGLSSKPSCEQLAPWSVLRTWVCWPRRVCWGRHPHLKRNGLRDIPPCSEALWLPVLYQVRILLLHKVARHSSHGAGCCVRGVAWLPTEPVVADPPLACGEVTGVAGKVAVVYRGVCPMIEKVRHAQTAGAVAAIIVNEGYVGALRASRTYSAGVGTTQRHALSRVRACVACPADAFSNSIVIAAIMISAASWERLSALPEDTIFAWKPHTAEGSAWDEAAGILALKREDWPADEAQRRRWLEDVVQANHPSSPAVRCLALGSASCVHVLFTIACAPLVSTRATGNGGKRSSPVWTTQAMGRNWRPCLRRCTTALQLVSRRSRVRAVRGAVVWCVTSQRSHGGASLYAEEPVDVETDVLAPLMMADITHRVLDSDGIQSEVPGADLLCAKFRDSFHIQEPFFKRGSKHASENHLRNLLRQQLCLEKLLILNAISAGQQMDYLRSQDVDAFEGTTARLLREVKAPVRVVPPLAKCCGCPR